MRGTSVIRTVIALALAMNLTGCTAILIGSAAVLTVNVVKDQRSMGAMIDDTTIDVKVLQGLAKDPGLAAAADVEVMVNNGIVLLTGTAPNGELQQRAGEIAAGYQGVRQVVNQVRIAGKPSNSDKTGDAYITSKVKTQLFSAQQLDATRIKVTTDNATVFLMGLVSAAEADRATAIARRVGGVARVVRVFEIAG